MSDPKFILVFSGKRKSGKDYVADMLNHRIGIERCAVLRLSGPLKEQYAKENGLDFEKLLDSSEYKEKYRADMIRWGEEKRDNDPGFFCRIIVLEPGAGKPVWIISDARRKTDIVWFQENYSGKVATVRVEADNEVREQRGWVFTEGVDDAVSECGLDSGINFDILIKNNGHNSTLESALQDLQDLVISKIDKFI